MQCNLGNHMNPHRYCDDRGCVGVPHKASKRYWMSEIRWWRDIKKQRHRQHRVREARELKRCLDDPEHEFNPPRTMNDWCW